MPAALDAALAEAVAGSDVSGAADACSRRKSGELILEQELADVALAELLAQLEERPVADLLADRDPRAELVPFGGGRDLEQIQIERAADRLAERRRDEAGRDPAGGRGERGALAGAELVDRPVEDDEREDVRLLERRRARQLQLRLRRPCR